MNRYIRKRFLIGLVVVLALATAGYVTVRLRIDPEVIRQQAVCKLSEYLDAEVSIERATFDPILGLRIEELSVRVPDDNGGSTLLARVPRVKLSHRLSSVFASELSYRDITLEDAEVYLERTPDGHSNIERLIRALRQSAADDRPYPTLRLERAQIHYTDMSQCDPEGRPLTGTFRNVSGSVVPLSSRGGKFRANVTGKDPELGMWTVRDATLDTTAATLDFRATSARIEVNDRLRQRMNGRVAEVWDLYRPEGGTVQVDALFRYDGSAPRTLDYELHLHFDGVAASYAPFPYRFDTSSGTVICRADGLELENLVGRSGPMKGTFNGRTHGYAEGCPLSIRIEGENIPLDAKLRAAFDAEQQQVWDEMSPRGSVNVVCRLDRNEPGEPIRVRVLAGESPDTRVDVRYDRFPYPLALEGRVLFDAGTVGIVEAEKGVRDLLCEAPSGPTGKRSLTPFSFEGLKPGVLLAHHGSTVMRVQGGVDYGDPYCRVDLLFEVPEGQTMPLDNELKQALSKPMQELWEELALSGTIRGRCRVLRTDPGEPELDVALELTDFRSRIRYEGFPYELGDSEGSVTFEKSVGQWPDGRIVVRDLRATRGEATVAFDGEIAGLREGKHVDHLDLNIRGANLPLDEDLRQTVSEEYREIWDYLAPTPESRVNVTCKIERNNDDAKTDFTLKLETVDSSLMCADFPYRVDGFKGSAEYCRNARYPDGMLQLTDLVSDDGTRRVKVSGVFTGFAEGRGVDCMGVSIEGRGIALDAKLREALAGKHRETFDRFRPEGIVDVTCVLKRKGGEEPMETEITIAPLGTSIVYDRFPVRITDVAGRIFLAGDEVRVSRLKGRFAGSAVQLDGLLHRTKGEPDVDLNVQVSDLELKPELEQTLPEKYRKLWRDLKLAGTLSLQGNVKHFGQTSTDGARVEYAGVIQPRDVSLGMGPGLGEITGTIHVTGLTTDQGHRFRGTTQLDSLACKGKRLTVVKGAFEKRDDHLRIYQLRGRLYGGEVSAQARIHLDDPITYGAVAEAESVHLGRLLREAFGTKTDKIDGQLSGKLRLQGKGSDTGTLIGEGDLRVREGKLWEIPFVLSLLKVLNLSLPERTAFTDGSCRFAFYGRKVHVSELNLIGNAISVYGRGTVNSGGAVNFSFETGFGRLRLPTVPFVSDIVRGVQQQIVSVRMTGTLKQPKLEILPIVPLTLPMMGLVDSITVTKEHE